MYTFKRSDWSITGNSGVTATVGAPIIKVQVGGSYLQLPILNRSRSQTARLRGKGLGVSFGVSPEFPWSDLFNVTISPDFYPSNGVGSIYRKVGEPDRSYTPRDLAGNFMVLGVTGAANLYGADLCLGLWLTADIGQCLLGMEECKMRVSVTSSALSLFPGGFPLAVLARTHAAGLFWGTANTTDVLSLAGSVFQYRMSSAR